VRIERAGEATGELVAALARLLPQLSPGREPPSRAEVAEIAKRGTLLVARDDGGAIVGTLTLVRYRVPSGLRARIEDVIVDEAARGRGTGEALTREALRLASAEGVRTVELTSAPERAAANRLYRRLGFEGRATNVYVWRSL
jgi:ribosomal protein S18 acetylase RimI-like enzyme